MIIEQEISNSTLFPDVARTIEVRGFMMNDDNQTFELFYTVKSHKNNEDISGSFSKLVPRWFLDNNQKMMVRDANFQLIPNPEFAEQLDEDGVIINEGERFLTKLAFDYIKELMSVLNPLLSLYITEENNDGRFNF